MMLCLDVDWNIIHVMFHVGLGFFYDVFTDSTMGFITNLDHHLEEQF